MKRGFNRQAVRQRGFTLIELLTVVAIVAVLAVVAVPSFVKTIRSNSVTSKVNELLGALQGARTEAVTRNGKVTLCQMDADDDEACDAAGSLQDGWIVFADADGDAVIDTGEEILASSSNDASAFTFDLDGLISITFGAMGTANISAAKTLVVCRGDEYAGQISLDMTGRATASKLTACP